MDIIIISSFIVAFIAGIAALFAPCCITVLLPSYLGSIFRQKRAVVLMTFVFFLGLLAVFLPLGLGVAGLGKLFSAYHNTIFIIGSIFLLLLGTFILLGIHISLPFSMGRNRNSKIKGAGSIFILGIFSGVATLCCAPVLAGVIALSVLPGSIFLGGMYALFYVLGMIVPLLIIAFFVDKTNIMKKMEVLKKRVSYSLLGKQIHLTIAELVSGFIFFFMGVLILYLAKTNQLAMDGGGYQTTINIYMTKITDFINKILIGTSSIVWIILAIIILFAIIKIIVIKKKKKTIE